MHVCDGAVFVALIAARDIIAVDAVDVVVGACDAVGEVQL